MDKLKDIPIEFLVRGEFQPREYFSPDEIDALAQSIREQGVVQPIIVREKRKNLYEIVAGERRWRAAQIAGLYEVPSIVKNLNDEQALAVAIIENIQRESLSAIEEAKGLQRLIDEFGYTHFELSERVGWKETTVTHSLRLLKLSAEIQAWVHQGKLSRGHAKVILSAPEQAQLTLAKQVVAKGLSVRALERLVKGLDKPATHKRQDPEIERLNSKLSEYLGYPAEISFNKETKKGSVVVKYNSLEELDGFLQKVGFEGEE